MRGTLTGWLVLFLTTSLAATSPGACPELAGRWGYGPPRVVAVSGTHAYFTSGSMFMVADLTDPASVPVVGRVLLPDSARGIAVAGTHAYVAADEAGLRVIDVSNPASPAQVGTLTPGGYAAGIAAAGSYVYLANGWAGLRIIDVSDPANPIQVGVADTPNFAEGVAVSGSYAYVADNASGLRVVSIADPANPVEVGALGMPDTAERVAVSGTRAYVADDNGGLRIIDVSTPSNPVEIGAFSLGAWGAADVAVSGTNAFLAYDGAGLRVVDVTNPTAPVEIGFLDTPGSAEGVALGGNLAVVADGDGGVRVISVAVPAAPAATFTIELPGKTLGVAVDGDYAFIANGNHGLRVLDISNPASPGEHASLETPGQANAVAIQDHIAYIADGGAGLRIVDVTTPTSPVLRGSVVTPGSALDVAVAGNHAFIAGSPAGLSVVDVSDPGHPTVIATLPLAGDLIGVDIGGGYAYLADLTAGLRIVDVTAPSTPVLVATVPIPDGARAVAVAGETAYVGDSSGRLRVIDVADPLHPQLIVTYDGVSTALGVTVQGDLVFVAQGAYGLSAVSVADRAHPELVGSGDTPGSAVAVAVGDGVVVVADSDTGLSLFDVSGCPLSLCSLTCTTTATPSLGLAPLTTQFTVVVTADLCGGAPAFDWSFGDGTVHSSEQNPTHAYAAIGSYPWSVTVTAGAHQTSCSGVVTVAAVPPRRFDFGTPSSPLAPGYTRVSQNTAFSGTAGFGWSRGVLASRDRGTGSDLLRDFVFTPDAGFDLLLPVGAYDVTVTMGDASARHDQMGLLLEGRPVDSVSTNAGQFATRATRTVVGDGVLNLGLDDLGGADPNAVINALVVTNAAPFRFDFGTPTSPVASGYTQVTPATTYAETRGYGWLSGTIGSRDRGIGTSLSRDFDFTPLGTFVVDVANGTYDVVVTMGDTTTPHDQMGIFIEGAQVDTVFTSAGSVKTLHYRAQVSDGQLTFTVDDLGGSDPNVVVNALALYGGPTGAPGTMPSSDVPKAIHDVQTVTSTIELADVPGTITDVNVTLDIAHTYDADVRAILIAPDNTRVALFEGVGAGGDNFAQTTLDDESPTLITAAGAPFAGVFRPIGSLATLDGKSPNGTWTLEIADVAAPDEGTLNSWSLTMVTALAPPSKRFDFGTPTSPIASGYTRVAHTTSYTGALGYGWLSGAINSRDRGAGGDLNRDFCFTPKGTFVVDLPSGTYDVTVISGDLTGKHDQMAISLEGVVAATVTANAGQYPATSVRTQVTDGQLTVLLKDNGGSDANVVINALEVTPVTP